MKQDQGQRIARILGADQVRERHRNFLCRGEAVFSVKNHGVRAVEHEHGRAGRLIFALMHLQVGIFDIQRELHTLALNGAGERGSDVEIERVAEFVLSRCAAGLNAGRHVAGVVTSKARFS